ncbi:MAG: SDR family NAD(P)-dependent oxidoreductase [Acidobacteriota bacterium]
MMEVEGKTMAGDFEGKVVLVAGGTGGLGRGVALAFLAQKARVVVTYRHEEELAALKDAAGADAATLSAFVADVTSVEAAAKLVEAIVAQFGKLDALVNTVGGYVGGVNLWELDPDAFERMLNMNVRSGFALSRAVVPVMLKQKSGSIVNVAAKAAFDHGKGASAYAASKAAAVAMMDSLAADVKGMGVRVNSILPSIIDTAVNRKAMPDAAFDLWPKPEEIARVVLFLCSDDAKVVHGAAIPVYGES